MNLKRHHVLYGLLAVSLMLALLAFMTPWPSGLSYRAPEASKTASSSSSIASSSNSTATSSLRFEIVTTKEAQAHGLSGRSNIPENYGMLFVLPQPQKAGFWMKDMLMPIDIIWLADDGTILGIEDSISPSTYPNSVYPPIPVRYVLETKAGEMRRQGWSAGTRIMLPLPYGT